MKKIVVLSVVVLAVILTSGCNLKDTFSKKSNSAKAISQEEAKEKIESFVKENLLAAGVEFSIEGISEENGMYRVKVVVKSNGQEQEADSYISKDGKIFFPTGAINIDEMEKKAQELKEAKSVEQKEIPKNAKPEIELFIMSYCPYGTQVEKGIIPVLETLGSKVKFDLKFVSYTMHGDEEADENMREYCIQKNNPTKIVEYLKCFLKSTKGGVTEAGKCMANLGINKSSIDSCIKASNEKFAVKSGEVAFGTDKEANEKYGVKGSPTLVINGVTASSGRDSASLLKTICSAFENEPAECQKELSSTAPSPGFGEGAGSDSSATCE